MAEVNEKKTRLKREYRHRGRTSQIPIYLGKQLRFFVNESDWKVLPMAAIIAALVAMVVRKTMFVNMEGTLMGAFALSCVAIWNGCFNSIQSVCRERAIVKREHRSGMHISSYVAAHMIYQFFLCVLQTAVSVYVMQLMEIKFPATGFMTPWMILDIGISFLLITYAADMMSLLISSIARTTTSAMTVMPFVLIFQLVFCGGVIPLPEWSKPLSNFTLSNYGIRAIAAQSNYNELPMETVWKVFSDMQDSEIEQEVSVGRLVELCDSKLVEKYKGETIIPSLTAGELMDFFGIPVTDEADRNIAVSDPVTFGELVEIFKENEFVQQNRDKSITLKVTLGEAMEVLGEENMKEFVMKKTAEAGYKPEYERSTRNIVDNWLILAAFALGFALLATLVLELIDKDKR